MTCKILTGCALQQLPTLGDQSINCCVTSPPYWGLRDYGVTGQMGLEKSPDEYVATMVAVFREVRRVLRDDGTLWLNLGDSYASAWACNRRSKLGAGSPDLSERMPRGIVRGKRMERGHGRWGGGNNPAPGLKEKDLIGIPWSVAKALQSAFYAGRIKNEHDRIWLSAIIDGEGSISGYHHTRKDDGDVRTGININITNSNTDLLDKAQVIWPASRQEHMPSGLGHFGNRNIFRWVPFSAEEKSSLLQELYPHLIAKKKQALLAWNFLEMMKGSKKIMHLPSTSHDAKSKRSWICHSLSKLNSGVVVDIPDWILEPPSLYESGWYLRSDIIWHKPNCMPESVTDRPTRCHEYIFLLSKSRKYFYDSDAIKEPCSESTAARVSQDVENQAGSTRANGGAKTNGAMKAVVSKQRGHSRRHDGFNDRWDQMEREEQCSGMRNKRDVWRVAPANYKAAHFATFPPDLIRPCILAGCPLGGAVLDPFAGSGTTGQVALSHGRSFVGIELNPAYVKLIEDRMANTQPGFM